MAQLARAFRPDRISVLVAHLLVNDAVIGRGGGERELHTNFGIFGVNRERFPVNAQYTALGHVHKAQQMRMSPRIDYSGSLLQLDFGEVDQDKSVNLVELHAGQPAQVTRLPITAGRRLMDVGSPSKGIHLNDLPEWAAGVGDAWLRVFVDVDVPLANLAAIVRDQLPNAVSIERVSSGGAEAQSAAALTSAGKHPRDLYEAYYASPEGRGHAPAEGTMRLFDQLLDEASYETP
jgi:exonuclease SbcD